ncbi:MAG: glycosyltransferase [Planctomycetes bacterium]|nr:glycosyltransferase [Planctomycetota bacterium]MCB9905296.1 glycosyltransferase [Planctomycetota bacterium]
MTRQPEISPSRVCVVVPSYCSWKNLERNLPGLVRESLRVGFGVLVSDDTSPDDTVARLREHFHELRLEERAANGGFGENCNDAVRRAEGYDYVYLLNADVEVREGFLEPLLEHFTDPAVFAVASVSVGSDGKTVEDAARRTRFKRGHLRWEVNHEPPATGSVQPTFFASGAHVLYRRDRFLELGGFDPLYAPFYWEDVDLSYRAWKRGWRVLVDHRSRVHHQREHSDIERTQTSSRYVGMNHRGRFLFTWKNIHDRRMLWGEHLVRVIPRALFGWLLLDKLFYNGFFRALPRLPKALAGRRAERRAMVRTDREIFEELERAW